MRIQKMGWFLNKVLPKNVIGICLAPFGIYIRDERIYDKVINHECIHWRQQIEMAIIPFYVIYILEYFIRVLIDVNTAYQNISFEREAKENEGDLNYLNRGTAYSWIKYLIKK